METALATVIVGTGVLAILAAQQAYHQKNDWAMRNATAIRLANELRELTLTLPMHDPLTGTDVMGPEPDELDDFASVVTAGQGTAPRLIRRLRHCAGR